MTTTPCRSPFMPDRRTDPEGAAEIWRGKVAAAGEAFRERRFPMSEDVYRATLYGLGFRGSEIDAEVAFAKETR